MFSIQYFQEYDRSNSYNNIFIHQKSFFFSVDTIIDVLNDKWTRCEYKILLINIYIYMFVCMRARACVSMKLWKYV